MRTGSLVSVVTVLDNCTTTARNTEGREAALMCNGSSEPQWGPLMDKGILLGLVMKAFLLQPGKTLGALQQGS